MNLQCIGTHALGAAIVLASAVSATAQVSRHAKPQVNSATHVSAEMTKGKLNPAESKPGDQVVLKLKDDLKANGQVLLKKGTAITGIVKNVKQVPATSEVNGQPNSAMELEWFAPAVEGKTAQQLSIALQSVTQISLLHQHGQNDALSDDLRLTGGGLVAGAVAVGSIPGRSNGHSNPALLSMPSVVAVDVQTTSSIDSSLGVSSSGQLFKTGRGELVSPSGSKQSVELFSHLNNDTVIAAQARSFEISAGAQMRLLVGVNKR